MTQRAGAKEKPKGAEESVAKRLQKIRNKEESCAPEAPLGQLALDIVSTVSAVALTDMYSRGGNRLERPSNTSPSFYK